MSESISKAKFNEASSKPNVSGFRTTLPNGKKAYGILDRRLPDRTRLMTDCEVYPDACVVLPCTEEQIMSYFSGNRPAIQDLFPDTDKAVREAFVSGTSPAEWDVMFKGKAKEMKDYAGYEV